jgi:tryptophan 7-halogenase
VKKFAVIGLGTSGIQAIAHFLRYLDNSWEIVSISDPNFPILGIGESTNPSFMYAMQEGADLDLHTILKNQEMDATIKLCTQYEKWREHDFVNPLLGSNSALHINTFKLLEWSLPRFRSKWGKKFVEIHGNVETILNEESSAVVTVDGTQHYFDFVMDCRGFPKDTAGYTFVNDPVNHCLVHNIPSGSDFMHTKHVATKDGWMFVIPLTTRTSHGYLFNDQLTSIKEAKQNFSKTIGVPVEELDSIEYSFKSYYAENMIEGRIIKNGNRAVFFEPMFANSLWLYDTINKYAIDYIRDNKPVDEVNSTWRYIANDVYEVICFFYKGGSTYDTRFWEYAKTVSSKVVFNSPHFAETIYRMKETNNDGQYREIRWSFAEWSLRQIDKNLGYNHFMGINTFS